eukprot:TRINITY_DN14564_c0_g1_i1.p1 TRINITY_DN14564_c0_g1~~TRINITY_DN14564_c0_g1_i1.p1  ORF type:complete len:522 (-),score=140.87 TRINITY_DN14564_c0_g1_i1:9-1574(-)
MINKESADWEKYVNRSTRSCVVSLRNYSEIPLQQVKCNLDHGIWRLMPSNTIPPFSEAKFAVTNKGPLGGAVGSVVYQVQRSDRVVYLKMDWYNPWIGEKACSLKIECDSPAHSKDYQFKQEVIDRHLMQINWTFEATAPVTDSSLMQSAKLDATWKTDLLQYARSVFVVIRNETNYELIRSGSSIPHGVWVKLPPDNISPQSVSEFGIRGLNQMAGVVAYLSYTCKDFDNGKLNFQFQNPFIGENYFTADPSKIFQVEISSAKGNNVNVVYIIKMKKGVPTSPRKVEPIPTPSTQERSSPLPQIQKLQAGSRTISKGFGIPLDVALKKDNRVNGLPIVVEVLCKFLGEHGLAEPNIFLKPGSFSEVYQLRCSYEENRLESTDLKNFQITSIAYTLKSFLWELPESIIPSNMVSYFLSFLMQDMAQHVSLVAFFSDFVCTLPIQNARILNEICKLLFNLHNSQATQFNAEVAGIVFAPILKATETTVDFDIQLINSSVTLLIEHYPLIFEKLNNPTTQKST